MRHPDTYKAGTMCPEQDEWNEHYGPCQRTPRRPITDSATENKQQKAHLTTEACECEYCPNRTIMGMHRKQCLTVESLYLCLS